MKAQRMFGGTKPKETGVQATIAKAQTGTQKVRTPSIAPQVKVRQVGVSRNRVGNNSQMVRDPNLTTKSATKRPNLPGKVDNRAKRI